MNENLSVSFSRFFCVYIQKFVFLVYSLCTFLRSPFFLDKCADFAVLSNIVLLHCQLFISSDYQWPSIAHGIQSFFFGRLNQIETG
jgi:hypothetical protein